VPERRSGSIISFPVVIADLDGERFLVAIVGERTNWMCNVQAADGRAVLRHGRSEAVRLEDVAVDSAFVPVEGDQRPSSRPSRPGDAATMMFDRWSRNGLSTMRVMISPVTSTSGDPLAPLGRKSRRTRRFASGMGPARSARSGHDNDHKGAPFSGHCRQR
jgi:hypothetical protein